MNAVIHLPNHEPIPGRVRKHNPDRRTAHVQANSKPASNPLERHTYEFDTLPTGMPILVQVERRSYVGLLVQGYGPRLSLRDFRASTVTP